MSCPHEIEFDILENPVIEFNISNDPIIDFDIEIGNSGQMLPIYDGPYEVTPRVKEQLLNTSNKSMTNDVKIFSIPYATTSNIAGGLTATIGIE